MVLSEDLAIDRRSSVNTISGGIRNEGYLPDDNDNVTSHASKTTNVTTGPVTMADETLLDSSENVGRRPNKDASNFGHSDRLAQPGLELRFEHLNFSIKGKQILEDISGTAHPGKVLAVMGPSGSGKTTLLNILGGRIECPGCQATIGGQHLNKRTRRKISYVLQQDIFFPNLTLEQTLQFSAELRLPERMASSVKDEIVSELIEQLDMKKCTKTIIGDNMIRGLSGGEKKRANIANELLTDPAVLLLDEPTSGLDSSTAYALTLSLKKYAVQSGKTVMMTIHQPSVQMFFQFDTVLLLSGGRIAYYGNPDDVLHQFAQMGFSCDVTHYNPADFILDVVKSGSDAAERLVQASNQKRLQNSDCPILRKDEKQSKKNGFLSNDDVIITSETKRLKNGHYDVSNKAMSNGKYVSRDPESAIKGGAMDHSLPLGVHHGSDASSDTSIDEEETRWPTSYIHQTKILTIRSFIQGKYRYLSLLKFIKTIGVALIMGLVWFQIGKGKITESQVNDISGALFFLLLFNSFNSLFDVLVIFPSEREVVNKERMSGSYRLSAYYISKSFSELPLCLVLPTISTVIFYWLAGLNGMNEAWAFFGTWLLIIGSTLSSQSMGLFVSTATTDFDHALVLAVFVMITFMLLGGFYIKNFPSWLVWLRYISPFMYGFNLLLYLEFDSDDRVICNAENSAFPSCNAQVQSNDSTTSSLTTNYVPYQEILQFYQVDVSVWICCLAIFLSFLLFRVVGYIFLRLLHKPIAK